MKRLERRVGTPPKIEEGRQIFTRWEMGGGEIVDEVGRVKIFFIV